MREPGEALEERVGGEPARHIFAVELGRAIGNTPRRLEPEFLSGVREVDAVGARVGTALTGDHQLGIRYRLDHRLGDLGDGEVIGLGADVVRPAMDGLGGSLETGGEGAGYVLRVNQRPPRCAVGEHSPHR